MGSTSLADATWAERSVFAFFMSLWIVYGLLNQRARLQGIEFDATTLVWCQEVLKIVISLFLFSIQDGGLFQLFYSAAEHWSMLCWYLIPAGLYALTDVLTYINLRVFDPATYHLLGEMKLVVTACVHQAFFNRRLNMWHWMALFVITGGCVIKTLDSLEQSDADASAMNLNGDRAEDGEETSRYPRSPTAINYLILVIQIGASTVAGVYNEKLLKDKPLIPINLQNMCLYCDGMIFLSFGMLFEHVSKKSPGEGLSPSNLEVLFGQPIVLAMACVMSTAGIITSRFLKVFDSVRKSIAVSLVIVTLPFLSLLFFGTSISIKMVVSIFCVAAGMFIYSSQPHPGEVGEEENGDEISLLPALSSIPHTQKGCRYSYLPQKTSTNSALVTEGDENVLAEEEAEIELPCTDYTI